MSPKVEEYIEITKKLISPVSEGGLALDDKAADDAYTRLDEIWSSLSDEEKAQIEAWRKERSGCA
jgi:hypothetical protein